MTDHVQIIFVYRHFLHRILWLYWWIRALVVRLSDFTFTFHFHALESQTWLKKLSSSSSSETYRSKGRCVCNFSRHCQIPIQEGCLILHFHSFWEYLFPCIIVKNMLPTLDFCQSDVWNICFSFYELFLLLTAHSLFVFDLVVGYSLLIFRSS